MPQNNSLDSSDTRTIAQKLTSGLYVIAGQSVALKIVSTAAQIGLAWILVERDYGLIGLAYTITAFAGLVERGGVSEVLIRRRQNFQRWVGTGAGMSLASGVMAMIVALFAAPAMARLYSEPRLTSLVVVLAIAMPIRAFAVVPLTFLKTRMQFRAVAWINLQVGLVRSLSTVLFALLQYGAYSFAIAELLAASLGTVVAWRAVSDNFRPRFSFRFWSYLFSQSKNTLVSGLGYFCIAQGDYVVLGSQLESKLVGIYFFAFSLASQFMFTLTASIVEVFTSAVVSLTRDPHRQHLAVCKSANLLTSLLAPACISQAIMAPSLMRFLWGTKWELAIPLVQILSIAWAFRVLESLNIAVFRANGMLKTQAKITTVVALAFLALLALMVNQFGMLGAAISVLAYSIVVPIPSLSLASRRPLFDRNIYASSFLPTLLVLLSFGVPYGASRLLGLSSSQLSTASGVVVSGVCLYLVLTLIFNPTFAAELKARFPFFNIDKRPASSSAEKR